MRRQTIVVYSWNRGCTLLLRNLKRTYPFDTEPCSPSAYIIISVCLFWNRSQQTMTHVSSLQPVCDTRSFYPIQVCSIWLHFLAYFPYVGEKYNEAYEITLLRPCVCVSATNNFFVYSLPSSCHLLWLHCSGFHTSRHIACNSCCKYAVVLLTCVCRCRGQPSTGVADSNSVRDMNICTRFLCCPFYGLWRTFESHSLYKCNLENAWLGIARGADPVMMNILYKGCTCFCTPTVSEVSWRQVTDV